MLSLGGVIGGESTGCTEATRNVFIEAALFDPVRTAATGRKLQLQSDARYRFERGLDPEFVRPGLEIATRLIIDAVRRRAERGRASPAPCRTGSAAITFAPIAYAQRWAASHVPAADRSSILEALGCQRRRSEAGVFAVEPPSWRGDIEGEADLVEEVLRIHGYDAYPGRAAAARDGAAASRR